MILAIDQGTTGSTCLMIDEKGAVHGRGYREITQHFPAPGLVEHDAEEILSRTIEAARDAMSSAGREPTAIGITNQRESVVVWDRASGKPLHRVIVWQDRRTAARCSELANDANRLYELTGLVPDPYFSATKLEWLLATQSLSSRARAGELAAGTIDSWLVYCLTGGKVHATEPTNASRTMLYDIARHDWSPELCDLFSVPLEMLPEVRPSSGSFGDADGAILGTKASVPIAGIAGDQQAALFGHACVRAGQSKNTYGTGAFLLMNTGKERPEGGGGLLTTIACDEKGREAYALEGAIFIAGAAIQWLRDGLRIIDSAGETEALARSIDGTDGVYFVPALVGLGAPSWELRVHGTVVGITRGTTRAHLVRAALESMAFSTHDVVSLMQQRSGIGRIDALRVDGGAASNDFLMQFQADVLGVPVERPAMVEMTALGAAGLAGLATGVWRDTDEFSTARDITTFDPRPQGTAVGDALEGWHRAVRATLAWARDETGSS
jgi:glycerol kinase